MHASIRNRQWRLEDMSLRLLAGLFVLAVAGFAIFYWVDRRVDPGPAPIDTAIAQLEQAVKDDPNQIGARVSLADAYYVLERYKDAAAQYEAALVLDKTSLLARAGLGRSLYAAGDRAGSAAAFQVILDAAKDADIRGDLVGAAYFFQGRIALDEKRVDDAITLLRNATLIDRADADAMQMLGAAYVAKGSWDEALVQLNNAVRFVPDFAEAYTQMALAYEGKGMQAEARYARAMVVFSNGESSKAAKELEAVTAASPNFASAFAGLGLAREKLDEKDAAAAAYSRALQIDPQNSTARFGINRLRAGGTTTDPHGSQSTGGGGQ